jgi:hypothetical protein
MLLTAEKENGLLGQKPKCSIKYKEFVRKFEEQSLQIWIEIAEDWDEIWKQNLMMGRMEKIGSLGLGLW